MRYSTYFAIELGFTRVERSTTGDDANALRSHFCENEKKMSDRGLHSCHGNLFDANINYSKHVVAKSANQWNQVYKAYPTGVYDTSTLKQ